MARGINKAILVGNLGDDPDTRYTQAGVAITKVSIATTSVRKNRDGESVEETQWHRVTFFGKLGEIAGEYLRKGAQVYVEGEIRYSKVDGDDGQTRYYTDIVANEMQMLGGRRDGEGGGQGGGQQRSAPQRGRSQAGGRQAPQEGRSTRPAAAPQPTAGGFNDDFADDDIPF